LEEKEPAKQPEADDDVREDPIQAPVVEAESPEAEVTSVKLTGAPTDLQVENVVENGNVMEDEIKAEDNIAEPANSPPPVKHYSKRQPKPTQEYENFKNQQMLSKRSKKPSDKEPKKPHSKRSTEKVKTTD